MTAPLRAWLVAALCWVAAIASAQLIGGSGPAKPPVPDSLASPRAALRTYFEGMSDGDVVQAVTALDLTTVSLLDRPTRGPQLANKLWAILNRETFVDLQKVPNAADSKPYVIPIHRKSGGEVGEVVVDKSPDGAFRVMPATLNSLDAMWAEVKNKPVIKGLVDPGEQKLDPAQWFGNEMGPELRVEVLGVQKWKLILLGIMLFIGGVLALIVRGLTLLLARVILKLQKTDDRYKEIKRAGFAVALVLFSSVVAAFVPYLGLPNGFSGPASFLALIAQFVGGSLLLMAVWDGLLKFIVHRHSLRNDGEADIVVPVISRLGAAVIVVLAGLTLLSQVGINVTALLATLGIGGIVLALAAKDSVENLFGSVMVLIERPFKIGDWIKIGDIDGEVEDIRLRSTRIRTFEDSLIVMPNSALVTKSVENYGKRRKRRFRTVLRLDYGTPPDKIEIFTANVRTLLHDNPLVVEDSELTYLNDFGPTALHVMLQCYFVVPTFASELEARSQVMAQILREAESLGISFAAPVASVSV